MRQFHLQWNHTPSYIRFRSQRVAILHETVREFRQLKMKNALLVLAGVAIRRARRRLLAAGQEGVSLTSGTPRGPIPVTAPTKIYPAQPC